MTASYVTVANLKTEIFIFYFAEKKVIFFTRLCVFISIFLCCVILATETYEKPQLESEVWRGYVETLTLVLKLRS